MGSDSRIRAGAVGGVSAGTMSLVNGIIRMLSRLVALADFVAMAPDNDATDGPNDNTSDSSNTESGTGGGGNNNNDEDPDKKRDKVKKAREYNQKWGRKLNEDGDHDIGWGKRLEDAESFRDRMKDKAEAEKLKEKGYVKEMIQDIVDVYQRAIDRSANAVKDRGGNVAPARLAGMRNLLDAFR